MHHRFRTHRCTRRPPRRSTQLRLRRDCHSVSEPIGAAFPELPSLARLSRCLSDGTPSVRSRSSYRPVGKAPNKLAINSAPLSRSWTCRRAHWQLCIERGVAVGGDPEAREKAPGDAADFLKPIFALAHERDFG